MLVDTYSLPVPVLTAKDAGNLLEVRGIVDSDQPDGYDTHLALDFNTDTLVGTAYLTIDQLAAAIADYGRQTDETARPYPRP